MAFRDPFYLRPSYRRLLTTINCLLHSYLGKVKIDIVENVYALNPKPKEIRDTLDMLIRFSLRSYNIKDAGK